MTVLYCQYIPDIPLVANFNASCGVRDLFTTGTMRCTGTGTGIKTYLLGAGSLLTNYRNDFHPNLAEIGIP